MDFNAPERITNIRDIRVIYEMNEKQEQAFDKEIETIEKDMNISTMSKQMAQRYENYLDIASQDDDTLEEKRFRVLAKINERAPYTLEVFKQRLETIAGKGNINVFTEGNHVTVRLSLERKKMYDCILDLVEEIVPLDQIVTVDVLYNRWTDFAECQYEKLSKYTWQQIMEEAAIKE
ncbi:MAG: putative phage tail protein [Lachnospiraceae bacterium]